MGNNQIDLTLSKNTNTMFSKLTKLVTLLSVISVATYAAEDGEGSKADIFDNDSEFMRGFETGLFLRTKGGTVEEYGCSEPKSTTCKAADSAFKTIKGAIEMAKGALSLDPIIDQSLGMVLEFLEGLFYFVGILNPSGYKHLDQYCTGMVFGLQGSKLLVKVANTLINPVGADGKATGTFDKKKKGGFVQPGWLGRMAEGVMNTAQNTMANMGGKNDEL